uniref:Preprotein translocase SecG subunit n=1 Tax=Hypnea nidifica TaxID=673448 RepID=UPI0027D9E3B6|nr:Preprotein translocase SecG subunit [Hypnea nidifica]WCH54354.1 Preprotein translocase SecG subunit [Hypnea nidifica]
MINFLSYFFIKEYKTFLYKSMRLIWYIVSIVIICLVLINNPKANNFNNFGQQSNTFSFTRSTQQSLNWIIAINILLFFLLTIFVLLFINV